MPRTHTYRPRHRVRHARDFRAAYDAKLSKVAGPLIVFTRPNGLPEHRLGLAVGKAVGNAVERHRVKRLLREAFRTVRPDLPMAQADPPAAFDLVVRVRPHDRAALEDYQRWLADAARRAQREHAKRQRPPAPPAPEPRGA